MTIHRVKHRTIPASAFMPDKSNGYRPKVLRRFDHELHLDCLLRVENEHGGDFELWADFVSVSSSAPSVPLNAPKGMGPTIATGRESLAQTTVDEIEVAPVSNLTHGCDFVIFQDSPICRELCQQKGQ